MSWRARAVFVSGTFRDMHEERDLLADRVFPALEEQMTRHYTMLERVDLRVGVETRGLADDHAKQDLVLKVCLEDVRRCRPFMIVLIGDRYGWVPPADRAQAAVEEAGFLTAFGGKSVTALEIEFGLWGDADQQTRSRIYFRQLDYSGMAEEDAIVFSDERAATSSLVPADERLKASERARALTESKQRLRDDPVIGPRCRNYPARWDPALRKVAGFGQFIEQVFEDLLPEMIAEAKEQVAAARAGTLPTSLEQFVAERSRGFRGREDIVSSLTAFAKGSQDDHAARARVLTGASGSGKSAIFARVYEDLATGDDDYWLLAHAAGIDPRSSSVSSLLEDWVAILADKLGVENPLATQIDHHTARTSLDARSTPQEAFADLLARAAARRPVVLLVDALDRFERTPQAQYVTWLPGDLPPNVRLIATAIAGSESEALAKRPRIEIEVLGPLTASEARDIAETIYARYHRVPNRDAVAELIRKVGSDGSPAHANPLWLVSALEELNLLDGDDFRRAIAGPQHSDEDRLNAMVVDTARSLPGDVEELYQTVFDRVGRRISDNSREGILLARAFTVAIALSRNGLREHDLAALIPDIAKLLDPSAHPLRWDALSFGALRRALRAHLVRRGEDDRWDFRHRQARVAARRAHLANADIRKQIHELIADYMLVLAVDDPLRENETMHHLIHADAREKAAKLYAGELTPGGLVGSRDTLAAHALTEEGLEWVTSLLTLILLTPFPLGPQLAFTLGERFLFDLDDAFQKMFVFVQRGEAARATERFFRLLLRVRPDHHGALRNLSISLNTVGWVETIGGNLEEAAVAYRESLAIARGLSDPAYPDSLRDVSVALNSLGELELRLGNLKRAAEAFAESLSIRRGLADVARSRSLDDVSISLSYVGQVELALGNLEHAAAAYDECLAIRRRLTSDGTPESLKQLASVLHSIGELELARGDIDRAGAVYAESLAITRGLLDLSQPESIRNMAVSLSRLGQVHMARGNLEDASAAYLESLNILRGLEDPARPLSTSDLGTPLDHFGRVEMERGNLDAAAAAFSEGLTLRRQLASSGRPDALHDLGVSLENVGRIEEARGNTDGALAAYSESLAIARQQLDPVRPGSLRDVFVSLHNIGRLEQARGRLEHSSAAHIEGLEIARRLVDSERPETLRELLTALESVHRVELARGNFDEAQKHLLESWVVLNMLDGQDDRLPSSRSDIGQVADQPDNPAHHPARYLGDSPRPHPAADAYRASDLNIAYQKDLANWKALPVWKRLRTKKPQAPTGI